MHSSSISRATENTANGFNALQNNTTVSGVSGNDNTATGYQALLSNTTGSVNTATGHNALFGNQTGGDNTATGESALVSNTTGGDNTATGAGALGFNQTGNNNTATGVDALQRNTTGSSNIALGTNAGVNLTTGSNNIDIGNGGVGGESGKIRIGTAGTQTAAFIAGIFNVNEGGTIKPLFINSNGQLGTQPPASSRRFKEAIKPMDNASEAILGLKPITFRYKNDNERTPQFGLIAEEVATVNPDLVVRDDNGGIYTVRYDAVNAMLLNEFLKEHKTVQELKSSVARQEAIIAAMTVTLNEQASLIRTVSEQLKASKPAPQLVANN